MYVVGLAYRHAIDISIRASEGSTISLTWWQNHELISTFQVLWHFESSFLHDLNIFWCFLQIFYFCSIEYKIFL